jgi:hypothetical protein
MQTRSHFDLVRRPLQGRKPAIAEFRVRGPESRPTACTIGQDRKHSGTAAATRLIRLFMRMLCGYTRCAVVPELSPARNRYPPEMKKTNPVPLERSARAAGGLTTPLCSWFLNRRLRLAPFMVAPYYPPRPRISPAIVDEPDRRATA